MAVAAAPMADTDIDNSVSLEVASHTQSGGSRKGAFRFSQFVLLSWEDRNRQPRSVTSSHVFR